MCQLCIKVFFKASSHTGFSFLGFSRRDSGEMAETELDRDLKSDLGEEEKRQTEHLKKEALSIFSKIKE